MVPVVVDVVVVVGGNILFDNLNDLVVFSFFQNDLFV